MFDIHRNLEANLARLEGRVTLDELLNRWPEWDIDYDSAQLAPTSTVRGWERLRIVLPQGVFARSVLRRFGGKRGLEPVQHRAEGFRAVRPVRELASDGTANHERRQRSHLALDPVCDIARRIEQVRRLGGRQGFLAEGACELIDPVVHRSSVAIVHQFLASRNPWPNLLFLLR
jgi:hypothetical protein